MAQGNGVVYNVFKSEVMKKTFDLVNDTLKIVLVSSYTPNIDTHTGYSSVSGSEYGSGSGYTAGGATLASKAVSTDTSNDKGVFDAADVTWTSLGPLSPATPSHCILYDDTHASDCLICYWELGTTATNGGNYTLRFNANGILTVT